ncbi:type 2 isopentenyl-diphosphate Delta-isomerase [Lactobacillus sp. LL6]|uniref:type 2 isopentenyl-diphosphate Delta-isomerase n=1 Tax=Lactobacillus sp. LL6 TaxID=2596827 RepID=UPI001185D2B9|nr:type 2 isopentenyl-diphosphate Delta-isomerase [Lactobacillus sp. LL6]TSO26348.1 type 2 isopentenyl-diphosphate Delta-isomerase [Lactobacillus sp. LL6]
MSIRSERKEEHLTLAQMFFDEKKKNSFDQMHLVRPALPESVVNIDSIKTKMFNKVVSAPFFINAMTGGSKKSYKVNQVLGKVAAKENIALALGSASILVSEHEQLDSFYIAREENPNGVLIANINPLTPLKNAQTIINELQADALQIHINAVQEISMPEGDRNFKWINNIRELRQGITVPIIVKEVGFGIDASAIQLLKSENITLIDVAGSGGTNFAEIENGRNNRDVSYLEDLGLPTVVTARIAQKAGLEFIVSGGVRNPLDVLKGLVLGGKYVGVANKFLQEYMENGEDGLFNEIHAWKEELAGLLAIYGCNNLSELPQVKSYYDFSLKNIIDQLI